MTHAHHERVERLKGEQLDFYQACVGLIERGMFVLPCGTNKKPMTPHGFKSATQDLSIVLEWAEGLQVPQPAVACAMSNLVVLDIDDMAAFEAYLVAYGLSAPNTLCVRTPSGGLHYYFLAGDDFVAKGKLCDGVDIKHKGYVLAPGAKAFSKRAKVSGDYSWVNPEALLQDAPEWLRAPQRPASAHVSASTAAPSVPQGQAVCLSEVIELLGYVDPDLSYPEWFPVLGAVFEASGGSPEGLQAADSWSARGVKYIPGEVSKLWDAFEVGRSAGVSYIAALAQRCGADVGKIGAKYRSHVKAADIDLSAILRAGAATSEAVPASLGASGALVPAAEDAVQRRAAALFKNALRASDAKPNLSSDYLVKGWLGQGSLSMIYGPSNCGKTFVALQISNCIARSEAFCGCRVRGGPVVVIATEGERAIANRLVALPGGPSENLHIVPEVIDLYSSELDVSALIMMIEKLELHTPPVLLVIDTLARSIGGADENLGADTAKVIDRLDVLRKHFGATVLIVHHSGKDFDRGARGHSSLRAAVDTELVCTVKGEVRFIESKKQRDMETGARLEFDLVEFPLGKDDDGDERKSCFAEFKMPSKRERSGPSPSSNMYVVLEGFRTWCRSPKGVAEPMESAAVMKLAIPLFDKGDAVKNRRAAREAIEGLLARGYLSESGDMLSLVRVDE